MKKNLNILFGLILLIGLGLNGYGQSLPVACGGSMEWYGVVGDNGNSDFNWEVTGGEIIRNYNDSILVRWNFVAGTHFIRVSETNVWGCTSERFEDIVIVTTPFVDVGLDEEVCRGGTYEFVAATSDITSLLWQDGSTGETFIASESGNYWVRVEDEFGCTNSDTARLIVHELPLVDLGPDTTLCEQNGSIVFDLSGFSSVSWMDGLSISSLYTVYTSTQNQEVWVAVTDQYGCEGTDTVVVRFCGEFDIPNAFTPNDDGSNDTWEIEQLFVFENVTVDVYNRWGERVFHSDGYSSGQYWNGTDPKGKKLPMDAYYYVIDLGNGEDPIVGTVTIIR